MILSSKQVAGILGVNESSVKRWADSGMLNCYRTPGGHRKFRREDILSFSRKYEYELRSDIANEKAKHETSEEINPDTGGPRFTPATAFSLLVFYTFAMQCMSTLAIVYRETKGWKWPLLQLAYMSALAYISSFAVFQLLS